MKCTLQGDKGRFPVTGGFGLAAGRQTRRTKRRGVESRLPERERRSEDLDRSRRSYRRTKAHADGRLGASRTSRWCPREKQGSRHLARSTVLAGYLGGGWLPLSDPSRLDFIGTVPGGEEPPSLVPQDGGSRRLGPEEGDFHGFSG